MLARHGDLPWHAPLTECVNSYREGDGSMKRQLFLGLLCVAVIVGATAATGMADPNLSYVGPHRHFVGAAEVGPRVCDNPRLQSAHEQFHNNAHRATASSIGPAAPGLQNGIGGEIRSAPC